MRNIRVITDSACDLSTELVKKYGITVIPLNIHIGDETFVDRSVKNSEFYKKMSLSKELPKTSHPSTETFLENYEGDEDLVVITVSSQLSSTYYTASLAQNMCEQNDKIRKIAVIDSEVGSIGQGQLAVIAAKLIEEDRSFEEIVDILEKIKKRIIFYGVLENLDNAIKSERISPLTGKIVGALNFNVIINIGNNVVKPTGTAKGYDTALASIQNLVFDRIGDVSKKSLFIGHANNLPKAIIMKNIMTKYNEFESVHIVEVGASIGTYTGEGAILVSVL